MGGLNPAVYVVDDDEELGRMLVDLAATIQLEGLRFTSAPDFLQAYDGDRPSCLVTDVRLPGMSGLELLRQLVNDGVEIPIIMISGYADVPMAVQAMTAGAMTFLEKPFRLQDMCEHLVKAVEIDRERRQALQDQQNMSLLSDQLTKKEREVMNLIAAGNTNKEMASILKLSIRAVEDRRSRVMKKLQVGSRSELVKMAKKFAEEC